MSWSKRLERPVVTPEGKQLVTLSDARAYALALPEARQSDPHVQVGIEALLMVAEGKGPMLLAQSGVAHIVHGSMKPLDRGRPGKPWTKRKSGA